MTISMKSDRGIFQACKPPSRCCVFVGRQKGVRPLLISTLIYTCLWCTIEFLSHLTYSKGTRHSIKSCTRTSLVTLIVVVFICHGVTSATHYLYHRYVVAWATCSICLKLWYLGNFVAYRSIPYTPVYPSYPVLRCLVYSRVSVHSGE